MEEITNEINNNNIAQDDKDSLEKNSETLTDFKPNPISINSKMVARFWAMFPKVNVDNERI